MGTRLVFYRNVLPCSELHRPNTEASQIAEVHLTNSTLQDEGRVRDGEHIVGADSTLHFPTILPPGLPALQNHSKIIQAAPTQRGYRTTRVHVDCHCCQMRCISSLKPWSGYRRSAKRVKGSSPSAR